MKNHKITTGASRDCYPDAVPGPSDPSDPYAERILDAARHCLLRDGLRQTSLDDIAATAGVGRATLFRRFPNRRALLLALATREATAAINAVDQAVADIDDPTDFLEAGLIAVLHQITGNDLLQRLLVTDPEVVLPVASAEGSAILAMGREYIAGQLRRIGLGEGDLQAVAEMLARLVLSLALNPVSVLPLDDDLRLAAFVRQTVAPLIVNPSTR